MAKVPLVSPVYYSPPKSDGTVNAYGKVYFYDAGTTTPKDTYTTAAGSVANANPVILDANGTASIWGSGAYKVVVKDSADNTIDTEDNYTAFASGSAGTFADDVFILQDNADSTKQMQFQLSSITTGTTSVVTVPTGNFTIAKASDVSYRGATVYNSTNQSLSNNTTTAITFDSEVRDTDSIHSTSSNTSRMTVPSGVTKVRVRGRVSYAANSTGIRVTSIKMNGSDIASTLCETSVSAQASGATDVELQTAVVTCVAGDYFELYGYQNSGGALNAQLQRTWLEMDIIP